MSPAQSTSPMPDLEPLQLLYVTNGLPLTAERWWQAHHYYQHRQNLHYQSLQQPGIVCGLGVRVIPAPETVPSELRDARWVEIQPGMAIDWAGNPIVVDAPTSFRITSEVIDQPVTVYVVLAYVNPRTKQWASLPADVVKEEFRINERTTPPDPDEVELCRIELRQNWEPLQQAAQVLNPTAHELDLRHRQQVRSRPQHALRVGLIDQLSDSSGTPLRQRLTALLQSIEALYPSMAGPAAVETVTLTAASSSNRLPAAASASTCTVLVLPYSTVLALTDAQRMLLQQHIAQGSTLLIEYADTEEGLLRLSTLHTVRTELHKAIADLQDIDTESGLATMRQDLRAEQAACEAALQAQIQQIAQPVQQLLSDPTVSPTTSVLTSQPFLFDALPQLPTGPLHLLAWEGVVLAIGPLSAAWTSQQFDQPLDRATLRASQELGINILYQASRRQQLVQAQQPTLQERQP